MKRRYEVLLGVAVLGFLCQPLQASTYTVPAGGDVFVPLAQGDTVDITYTGALPATLTIMGGAYGDVGLNGNDFYQITAWYWSAEIDVEVGGITFPLSGPDCGSNVPSSQCGFPLSQAVFELDADTTFSLTLEVTGDCAVNLPGVGSCAGFTLSDIYATVGIDPEPSGATPLPATLPLFAAGLGLLGLLGRRRKKAERLIPLHGDLT